MVVVVAYLLAFGPYHHPFEEVVGIRELGHHRQVLLC